MAVGHQRAAGRNPAARIGRTAWMTQCNPLNPKGKWQTRSGVRPAHVAGRDIRISTQSKDLDCPCNRIGCLPRLIAMEHHPQVHPVKNNPFPKAVAIASLACVFLALASAARAEDEKVIKREGTYTTSKGGSGKTSSTTTKSNGVVTRQETWTNAAGGTGTRQSQTEWNKSTNSATVNWSVTRPNGATTAWQGTKERTAPGVIQGSGTITQANGKKGTYT